MARNLLRAGFDVRAYNRTRAKAEPLEREGALIVEKPSDAVVSGGIVITMLSDDRALEAVALNDEFAARLGAGGVHVSMSTVSPETSRRVASHHETHEAKFIAAPVFGRPDAAAAAKLWVCTSGDAEAKERAKPLFAAISQGVFDFGADAGAANVAKLVGNFLIASAMEAMAEGYTLAEKCGLSRTDVAQMIGQTLFACPVYQGYGQRIAAKNYEKEVGFKLTLGLKDVRLVLQTGEANETPLPFASVLRDRFISAIAKGRGEMDWSTLAAGASDDAGNS